MDIDRQLLTLAGLQTGAGEAKWVEKNVVGLAGRAAHVDHFRVGIPVEVRRRFPAGTCEPIQADLDGVDGQVGVGGCQLDFVVHEPVRPNRGTGAREIHVGGLAEPGGLEVGCCEKPA